MSNEVLNVIKKRRSIRTYKADAIPEEILNAVLEAGTFAPTGGGKQSPDYCCDHIATRKYDAGSGFAWPWFSMGTQRTGNF